MLTGTRTYCWMRRSGWRQEWVGPPVLKGGVQSCGTAHWRCCHLHQKFIRNRVRICLHKRGYSSTNSVEYLARSLRRRERRCIRRMNKCLMRWLYVCSCLLERVVADLKALRAATAPARARRYHERAQIQDLMAMSDQQGEHLLFHRQRKETHAEKRGIVAAVNVCRRRS